MDLDLVGAVCALFYELSEFLSTYLETVLLVYGRTVASVFEVASLLSAAEESAAAAVVSAEAAVVSVELLEEPQPAMERTIAPAITADNNFALFFIMTS